jgi:hypothetical protein
MLLSVLKNLLLENPRQSKRYSDSCTEPFFGITTDGREMAHRHIFSHVNTFLLREPHLLEEGVSS